MYAPEENVQGASWLAAMLKCRRMTLTVLGWWPLSRDLDLGVAKQLMQLTHGVACTFCLFSCVRTVRKRSNMIECI